MSQACNFGNFMQVPFPSTFFSPAFTGFSGISGALSFLSFYFKPCLKKGGKGKPQRVSGGMRITATLSGGNSLLLCLVLVPPASAAGRASGQQGCGGSIKTGIGMPGAIPSLPQLPLLSLIKYMLRVLICRTLARLTAHPPCAPPLT